MSSSIYQFYVKLEEVTPTIWRRFQVRSNMTASRLCYIIMTLFEMKASHLFALEVDVGERLKKT